MYKFCICFLFGGGGGQHLHKTTVATLTAAKMTLRIHTNVIIISSSALASRIMKFFLSQSESRHFTNSNSFFGGGGALMLVCLRTFFNGVHCCTNSRQVALERTEPLPRQKCALDIPDGNSFTALLTSFDLLKGNFRPKRVGNVAQRQRRIRIVDSTAASGRASG